MKIRAISLNNVRRFTSETRIDGIGDGLNVLCEPNEFGKSTLFDAVQALFFKPHGSRDKEVMALQPHAGGAPEVTVEVETAAGHFVVSKRWLSKPAATVTQGGRLIAQAGAAESWLEELVGGNRDGGPSGLDLGAAGDQRARWRLGQGTEGGSGCPPQSPFVGHRGGRGNDRRAADGHGRIAMRARTSRICNGDWKAEAQRTMASCAGPRAVADGKP